MLQKKEDCCGCYNCQEICPVNCIAMLQDSDGFDYPEIKKEICVKCNRCEQVCPLRNSPVSNVEKSDVYGGWNIREEDRVSSSSGGIFTLLAETILARGGVVFGAELYDRGRKLRHAAVAQKDDLGKLKGSKYIQSDLTGVFTSVRNMLSNGTAVLFAGTPCQTAALGAFLGTSNSNLYLIDFICHGVPSIKAWREYLSLIESKTGKSIQSINFRSKAFSWKRFGISMEFDDGSTHQTPFCENDFMEAFLSNRDLRPSCFACPFKGNHRHSDITLGDFWGVEHFPVFEDDDKGVSLISVNTERGKKLWDAVKKQCYYQMVSGEKAYQYNSAAVSSVIRHPNYKRYYELLGRMPYDEVVRKTGLSLMQKVSNKIRKMVGA